MPALALAACLAGTGAPTAEAPRVLRTYFGDLGAPAPDRASLARALVRTREEADLDFLALVAPAPSDSLSKLASGMTRAQDFVALDAWSFGPPEIGQPIVVLGTKPAAGLVPAIPVGRFDLFYRFWLPHQAGTDSSGPLVHLPMPMRAGLDYGQPSLGSLDALREATAPYVRTMDVAGPRPGSDAAAPPHTTDAWMAYLGYLNAGFRVAPTAGRALTMASRASEYRTAILAQELTTAALLEAIRQRRVYASEDRNLRVSFSINGYPMGSVVPVSPGTPLRIEMTVSDPNEPDAHYLVSLRRDVPGGRLEATTELFGTDYHGDGRVVLSQFRRSRSTEYFLVELSQRSHEGFDVLWTAPIWLVEPAGSDRAAASPGQPSRP